MVDFTTNALLYPLTKGDVKGHAFHGNQWENVGGSGETPRPPVGTFQLSPQELTALGARLHGLLNETGSENKMSDQGSVEIAKSLGMDKPATRVASVENPTLYRGCDKVAAESLLGDLEHFGGTGGIAFGSGVYFTNSKDGASEYSRGTLISASVDPNAKIAKWSDIVGAFGGKDMYYMGNMLSGETLKAFEGMTPQEKTVLNEYASMPSNAALLLGYQGYSNGGGNITTILDRSTLKVAF